MLDVINISEYLETVRDSLKPPVSNKLLYNGEHMKVMIVGGPNERDDFHVEKGEELFYQLIGDMNLDIMEGGMRKRIPITEGEFFLLPACVPHSPQRYANTIGIVFERGRLPDEIDAMRWYVPNTQCGEIAFEDVFHCNDLGTQIKAAIEKYRATQQNEALQSMLKPAYPPDYFQLSEHKNSSSFPSFMLTDKLKESHFSDASTYRILNEEFIMDIIRNEDYTFIECAANAETFLWQLSGHSEVVITTRNGEKHEGVSLIVDDTSKKNTYELLEGCVSLVSKRGANKEDSIFIKQLTVDGITLAITNITTLP